MIARASIRTIGVILSIMPVGTGSGSVFTTTLVSESIEPIVRVFPSIVCSL